MKKRLSLLLVAAALAAGCSYGDLDPDPGLQELRVPKQWSITNSPPSIR